LKQLKLNIPTLKESNTQKGFFEIGEFSSLRDALPCYLKPVVTFAYITQDGEPEKSLI